jgi:hypothetical protein
MPFGPHVPRADGAAIRALLHEEVAPLLVRRMRAGIWLLLAALALFAIEALAIYRTAAAVCAVQLATLLAHQALAPAAAMAALGLLPRRALRGVRDDGDLEHLTGDPLSALLLFIVLTMGTAMLLPWRWPTGHRRRRAG